MSPKDAIDRLIQLIKDQQEYAENCAKVRILERKAKEIAREGSEAKLRGDKVHEEICFSWAETLWEEAQSLKEENSRPMKNSKEKLYGIQDLRDVLEDYITDDIQYLKEIWGKA